MSQRLTPMALTVLALLHEGAMHPYEMHQLLRQRYIDRVVKLKAGTLYHTVDRLAERGLIESTETSRSGRRPERTVYAVREPGREAFAAQTADMLANPAEEYPEYPLALTLANDVAVEIVIAELDRRVEELGKLLALDDEAVDRVTRLDLPRQYWLDISYQRAMRQAELDWTSELVDNLRGGSLEWGAAK